MPGTKRRSLLARRRRHDDEGEEDGSTAGDIADYASTAGSISTYAEDDGDKSHASLEDDVVRSTQSPALPRPEPISKSAQAFRTTTDTNAMMNGLTLGESENNEVLDFENAGTVNAEQAAVSKRPQPVRTRSQPTTSATHGQSAPSPSYAQPTARSRYFLHDDRHRPQVHQPSTRGRGHGANTTVGRGAFSQQTHDAAKQWTHDLHETVNQMSHPLKPIFTQPAPPTAPAYHKQPTSHINLPNRSFSTTTVLGNVPVSISLPGIAKQTKVMVKKHYTLLPEHRPPLRRDKPVRISIPDEHPRYIFPSTERSFIFIPRAMRPNQQQYRGRGRGSFHGSRRPSVFSYTPSVGMSRRPSFAASNSGSGIHTPTGPHQYPPGMTMQKPVVRMPGPPLSSFVPTAHHTEVFMGDNSAMIHSPSATLPMHQPIPQKTVSLADIESPTKAPPQQSQQPFHQQMPNVPEQLIMPHIPEGAIYAQPFQPFPPTFQPMYYGQTFQPGMAVHGDYASGPGGPVLSMHHQPQQSAMDPSQPHVPHGHESNGMVYYYDPSQQYMAPMMTMLHQPTYYYPPSQNPMFYQ